MTTKVFPVKSPATPAAGYRFMGWSGGSCAGQAANCTITATIQETDTATFAIETFSVAASAVGGNGTATVTDTGIPCVAQPSCTVNLNDSVLEGLRLLERPVFSVQYHPEAAPGPHDAADHFDHFCALLEQKGLERGVSGAQA